MVFVVSRNSKILVRGRIQMYNLSKSYLEMHWALSEKYSGGLFYLDCFSSGEHFRTQNLKVC